MESGDNYRPERTRSPERRRNRSRSYSPRRSRSASRDYRQRDRRDRSRSAGGNNGYNQTRAPAPPRQFVDKEQMVASIKEGSQQARRVYVGNLSYDVKWQGLKDFMRQAGEVVFSEVLELPNGMSKGCGIVEYATPDQAQQAIATLTNKELQGRVVYVREDREQEPRFGGGGGAPRGGGFAGPMGRGGGFQGGYGGGPGGAPNAGRQLYISNLPYTAGWQDLKDLFRGAAQQGQVIRADVHQGPDGRPKGSGIVVFESPDDAANAIAQFNGYDWQGRMIEVREDRFAGGGGMGGGFAGRGGVFQGGFAGRGGFGGPRGGFGGGFQQGGFQQGGFGGRGGGYGGGFGGRGGFGGGFAGGMRGGYQGGMGGQGGGYGGGAGGGFHANGGTPAQPNPFTDNATGGGDRSEIIFVRNLPWSTSNDDLIELFQTIGKVEQAEIQFEGNGRSKGTGVVRFDSADNADSAITKFTGYQYGGRPLGLSFVKYVAPGSYGGGIGGNDPMMMDHGNGGDMPLTQDQIM